MGLLLDFGMWLVFKSNPVILFHAAEPVRTVEFYVNDLIWCPVLHDAALNTTLLQFFAEFDLRELCDYWRNQWAYRDDPDVWDTSNPPAYTFVHKSGDCDDYARLAGFAAHSKGYETYFVYKASPTVGHAMAIYYDTARKQLVLEDINWRWEIRVADFVLVRDIRKLVNEAYPDTIYFSIRTWDMLHVLYRSEVKT
jgi:hypothetical protein